MDANTTAEATAPATETIEVQPSTVVVKLAVCHGNYREDFYGSGATILAAAENAAVQSSYSSGLFDRFDRLYSGRESYRGSLELALSHGEVYRGFGWCDFSRIA